MDPNPTVELGTGQRDLTGQNAASAAEQASRLVSCSRCKRRKQRCDKVLPRCTSCQKSGSECIGMVQGAQERKGPVTALMEHVAALEAELRARGGQERQQSRSETNSSRDGSPADREQIQPAIPSILPASTTAAGGDSSMSMNHLSLSAVAEPRNRGEEFLKQLSTPRLITGVTETYGGNPESTGRVGQLWEAISQYIRNPSGSTQRLYIPRDETFKALDTYLEVVDFRYPRLPVKKVRSGMNAISAEDGESAYNELISTSPAHIFMAYLVIAIVPLVSDSYPISQGSWVSAHLLSKCLKLLNRVFLQEDGVDIIQCLHLLVILSIHCSTAGSSWHLIGFALNKCIALGYHREESRAMATLSESDLQQRRWAFWGCYLLDRLICAGLGRPFSIEDEDIFVPLPSEMSEESALEQANQPTTKKTTPASKEHLQTKASIHLFRYAILLSSATRDRPAISQGDDSPSPGFDDLLGQALYWRTTSPLRGNQALADIHRYQLSLYNTLTLRVAIRELKDAYIMVTRPQVHGATGTDALAHSTQHTFLQHKSVISDSEQSQGQGFAPASSPTVRLFQYEHDRLSRINLIGICRAVARSLDRSRMTSRPYLSFLTGYSSLSMGLACLYYLAVSHYAAPYETSMATFPSMLPQTAFDETPSRRSTGLLDSLSSSTPETGYRSDTRNSYRDSNQRLYTDPQALVDLACRKLEVAERQFPRLQEYRMILEKLRALVCHWSSQFHPNVRLASMDDQIAEFRQSTSEIGPPHLKTLAEAILYLLAL
ncbi:hypothetical protein CC79DRAFT_1399108 [Sarocladium strictum]